MADDGARGRSQERSALRSQQSSPADPTAPVSSLGKQDSIRRAADWLVARRVLLSLLAVAFFLAAVPGLTLLVRDNDYEAFLGRDNPDLQTVEWLQERYEGAGEVLRVIYRPYSGDVLDPSALAELRALQDQIEALEAVLEASIFLDEGVLFARSGTPSSLPSKRGDYGVLAFEDLLERVPEDQAAAVIGQLQSPAFSGRSVGRSGTVAAVTIRLKPDATGELLNAALTDLAQHVEKIGAGLTAGETTLAGVPLFNSEAEKILRQDVRTMVPIAVLLVGVVLYLFLGTVSAVGMLLTILAITVVSTLGIAGYLGISVNVMTTSAVLVIATLAVADGVHFLATQALMRTHGWLGEETTREALVLNLKPFLVTTVTTVIGYATLFLSPSPAIRSLGGLVIIGVTLALAYTLFLLPTLSGLRPTRSTWSLRALESFFRGFGALCACKAGVIMALGIALSIALISGAPRNQFEDTMVDWFAEGTDMRRGLEAVNADFSSNRNVIIAQQTLDRDFVAVTRPSDPASFDDLRAQSERLATSPAVERVFDVFTAAAAFERAPLVLNDLADGPMVIEKPGSGMLVDSALLTPVRAGYASFALSHVELAASNNREFIAAAAAIEQDATAALTDRTVRFGSLALAFARMSETNSWNILLGAAIALGVISVVLFIALKSVGFGCLAILANVIPILAVYGIWGHAVGTLNLAAVTVLSVSLGIVVDDTVHVLSKWRRVEQLVGETADASQVASGTLGIVGLGVTLTTIILGIGFFLLGQSDFMLTAQKANMVGWTLVCALVFDLAVIPAMLVLLRRRSARRVA